MTFDPFTSDNKWDQIAVASLIVDMAVALEAHSLTEFITDYDIVEAARAFLIRIN